MFFVSFKGKNLKKRFVFFFFAVILLVVFISLLLFFSGKSKTPSPFETDLTVTKGVGGFLRGLSLEFDKQESSRFVTFPQKEDLVFNQYAEFLEKTFPDILDFSGKKVEERYIRLKNKTEKQKTLFAVLYIHEEEVVAAHLSTLEEGSGNLPVTAFG